MKITHAALLILALVPLSAAAALHTSLYTPEQRLLSEPELGQEYVWFGDRPVAQFDGASARWTVADHLSAPVLQTTANRTVAWRMEASPYGDAYAFRTGEGVHQPLRFPGQEQGDSEGDLTYNVHRWYRDGWGRYTTPDPMGFAGGSANLYAYVGDNPLSGIDPQGLVTVNITHLPPETLDHDELRNRVFSHGMGGQTLFGAAMGKRSIDCDCQCQGGYWKASVTINVGYQILATTCPECRWWPSVSTIFAEEQKHVDQLLASTDTVMREAQSMEAMRYPIRALCSMDCEVLRQYSDFLQWLPRKLEMIPGLSPHSHGY